MAEALKRQAEQVFAELKAANDCNDLKRVGEILATLERGETFVFRSESIIEKVLLKTERNRLQTLAAQLQTDIQTLLQSKTYQAISQIEDWDTYFAETAEKLREQVDALAV